MVQFCTLLVMNQKGLCWKRISKMCLVSLSLIPKNHIKPMLLFSLGVKNGMVSLRNGDGLLSVL